MVGSERLKRKIKMVRNLVADPPPRNAELVCADCQVSGDELRVEHRAGRSAYRTVVRWSEDIDLRAFMRVPRSDRILAAISLALSPELFVLSDFATVRCDIAPLTEAERDFWADYLRGGLAQFRYQQGLDPRRQVTVQARPLDEPAAPHGTPQAAGAGVLVMNGGGKDTAVAVEIVKAAGKPYAWFSVNPNATSQKLMRAAGETSGHSAVYRYDAKMRADARYQRRHFPFFASCLSLSLVPAVLHRYACVVAANEHSANVGNLLYRGFEVNHQFSKSFGFEERFDTLIGQPLVQSARFLSVVRPFGELTLAAVFAAYPQYFGAFVSCNTSVNGVRHQAWCGRCAKCAFIALALGPFVTRSQLEGIFGTDPFASRELRRHVLALVDEGPKPWECVGTKEECRLALALLLDARPDLRFGEAPLRAHFEKQVRGLDVPALRQAHLGALHGPHRVPDELLGPLRDAAARLAGRAGSPAPATAAPAATE